MIVPFLIHQVNKAFPLIKIPTVCPLKSETQQNKNHKNDEKNVGILDININPYFKKKTN